MTLRLGEWTDTDGHGLARTRCKDNISWQRYMRSAKARQAFTFTLYKVC
jgi:hypothetical protein